MSDESNTQPSQESQVSTKPRPQLPPRQYIYKVMMARSAELTKQTQSQSQASTSTEK